MLTGAPHLHATDSRRRRFPIVLPATNELRLLIVNWRCPKHPQAGGAEVHLHEIARRLASRGAQIGVVSSGWRGAERVEQIDGVLYHRVGSDHTFAWLHRHVLRRLDRPSLDLIVDDISKIPLGLARRCRTPVMAWCHHIHGETLYRQLPAPIAWAIQHRERQIPRLYPRCPIMAVSQSTQDELARLGVDRERLGLLPNAIDHAAIAAHPAPKSPRPLLVYLGRLERYKNIDCILRAFARVRGKRPDAELLILGKGADESRLRSLASQVCPDGVTFRGFVSEAEKAEMLHRAWLLLASSEKEGWGICVIEANAAGTPVIASDVPGHRDSVLHGTTGFLYPFDDDAAMAKAIDCCLEDEPLRRRASGEARRWAATFTWEHSTDLFLQSIARYFPHLEAKAQQHLGRHAVDERVDADPPSMRKAVEHV